MSRFVLLLSLVIVLSSSLFLAQEPKKDKGKFVTPKNEFWNEIKEAVEDFESPDEEETKTFKMDFSGYQLPKSVSEFTQYWHNEPISQGWSGMCWNFCTTSLYESEINRLQGKKIKISELHNTYWEYVEKARGFIKERGKSHFGEGSQSNALIRIWKKYGCVPSETYTGMKTGQKHHGHEKMYNEMMTYLNSLKTTNAWNEDIAIENIKSILDYYIGKPPKEFDFEGKKMTPVEFFNNVVKLNLDEYVDIMSLMQFPYYTKAEYKVPDNWWHSTDYYNIPLDEFLASLKNAVKKGYTVAIGGDVSESGYDSHSEVAMIPTYDIPSEYIDENARQFRFSNGTTTDDHGIHIVGYKEQDGKFWFLIKDSGAGSRNGTNKGYYFFHEDYVKLKMMSFMVHKSAVEDILKKFK
ncbi:MAG: C1 family peptidase [bacterium]